MREMDEAWDYFVHAMTFNDDAYKDKAWERYRMARDRWYESKRCAVIGDRRQAG